MEANNDKTQPKWADSGALCSITLAICILCQAALLTGKVDPIVGIATLPWILASIPVLLTVVIIMFRNGDLVGATANGLLGVILMGQLVVKGIYALLLMLTKTTPPPSLVMGGFAIDAAAFLCGGIILIFVGFLCGFISRFFAAAVWVAAIGFFFIAAANSGLGPILGLFGGICLLIIGIWFLYMGIAQLMNGAAQKTVLPLGKPLFTP